MKIHYAAIIIYYLLLPVYVFADGPSIDCKNAKKCIEKFICADKDLSTFDKKMSETYANLLAKLQGKDKELVKQNQVRWIEARDERCQEPDVRKDEAQRKVEKVFYENLFTFLYRERIEELQEWEKYVNGEKTTAYAPWHPMCWKRQELVDRQFWPITGNASVCRAFEQVLNTTCEAPDTLQCNWTLPQGEKGFQKLSWQPLDWKAHWGLIEGLVKSGLGAHIRDELWKKEESNESKEVNEVRRLLAKITVDEATLRREFEEGRQRLSVATVDINNDGRPEQVVRMDRVPLPGTTFGVMVSETRRLDSRYESAFLEPNSSEGAEIMVYRGKTYILGWVTGFKSLYIWDKRYGYGDLCKLKYLKGEEKK